MQLSYSSFSIISFSFIYHSFLPYLNLHNHAGLILQFTHYSNMSYITINYQQTITCHSRSQTMTIFHTIDLIILRLTINMNLSFTSIPRSLPYSNLMLSHTYAICSSMFKTTNQRLYATYQMISCQPHTLYVCESIRQLCYRFRISIISILCRTV